ncbi:MAG: HEAT repeat domain-containing protein [Candidatus Riflebacteria bacterium]|nr:HEAT repeat domain-containing protein [Candidatus Riflebacteria bacterium]
MIVRDDSPFAQALMFVESRDPQARQDGIALLAEIGDARSLEVVRVLQNDEDPDVRAAARPVYQSLIDKGLHPRLRPGDELQREKSPLSHPTEILDEAFFLITRNFDRIVSASLRSGSIKILTGFLFICAPYWLSSADSSWLQQEAYSIFIWLFVIHQVLVRPYAWETTGRAILANYPEKSVRKAAIGEFSSYRFQQIFFGNALFRLVMLGPILFFWQSLLVQINHYTSLDPLYVALAIAFMAFILYLNPFFMPLHILSGKPVTATISESIELGGQKRWVLNGIYLNFLAMTLGLYIMLGMNVLFILQMLFNVDHSGCIVGAILIADAIIDPLWMSCRLLITRLCMNSSSLEGI